MRSAPDRDEGSTLVELLMAVLLTAVLVGAVAAALTTALRNQDSTRGLVADSVDAQILSTYLPGDVQNAGPAAGDLSTDPADTAGCSGLTGDNVLALTWTDAEAGADYGVTYRTVTVGEERRLLRFTCGGATEGATIVARGMAPVDGAVADLSADPRIVFTLRSARGYASRIAAMRRTYAGGSVAPPPLPCFVDAATLSPPAGQHASGTLLPTVELTVQASGGCGTLRATYSPDPAAPAHVDVLGFGPGTTVTTLSGSGWTSGDRPLTLSSNGAFLAEVPFLVTDAPTCAVTAVRTNPTSGTRAASPSPNRLESESGVRVTADFTDTCVLPHQLEVSTDGDAPRTYDFPTTGLTRWVTVPADVAWSDGIHVLTVKQGTTTAATGTFVVSPAPCSVSTPTAAPASVKAQRDGTLNRPVTVTVTTTGVCDALSVRYTPRPGTEVLRALVPDSGSTTWTYLIGSGDHVWTTGTKTLEVVAPTGVALSPPRGTQLDVR